MIKNRVLTKKMQSKSKNSKINGLFLTDRILEMNEYQDMVKNKKNKINKKTQYGINNEKIGAFIKGGEIICKKMRIRRSIKKMKNDPLTIIITLDSNNKIELIQKNNEEINNEIENEKKMLIKIKKQNRILKEYIMKNIYMILQIRKLKI